MTVIKCLIVPIKWPSIMTAAETTRSYFSFDASVALPSPATQMLNIIKPSISQVVLHKDCGV